MYFFFSPLRFYGLQSGGTETRPLELCVFVRNAYPHIPPLEKVVPYVNVFIDGLVYVM